MGSIGEDKILCIDNRLYG